MRAEKEKERKIFTIKSTSEGTPNLLKLPFLAEKHRLYNYSKAFRSIFFTNS